MSDATMTNIRLAGRNAFQRGANMFENPHPRGSAERVAWFDGFLEAGGLL